MDRRSGRASAERRSAGQGGEERSREEERHFTGCGHGAQGTPPAQSALGALLRQPTGRPTLSSLMQHASYQSAGALEL